MDASCHIRFCFGRSSISTCRSPPMRTSDNEPIVQSIIRVCVCWCFQSLQLLLFLRLRRHSRWAKAGLREPPAIRLRSSSYRWALGDVLCRSPARCTLKAVTTRIRPGGNSLAEGEDLNMPALRRTTLCPLRTSCSGSRQELDWMRSFSFWSGSAHNHLPPLESDARASRN